MTRFSAGGDEDSNGGFHRRINVRRVSKRIRTVGVVMSPRSSASDSTVRRTRPSEVDEDSGGEELPVYSPNWSFNPVIEIDENPTSSGIGSDHNPIGSVSVTLSDPDVLDCPICLDPLRPPVFQCENGHISCSPCCITMRNKCGSCTLPIGYNRCRAMEKVLESVKVPCKNTQYGCDKTISYSEKLQHEKTCNFSPCSCPHLDCDYIDNSKCLYKHFRKKHPSSYTWVRFECRTSFTLADGQKCVFFQDVIDSVIFILNRSIEPLGSFLNVICVAPTSSRKKYWYNLTAKNGPNSVNLRTFAESMPEWAESKSSKMSLLVPSDVVCESGKIELELIIREDYKPEWE